MLRAILLVAAAAVYLGVVGCIVASDGHGTPTRVNSPFSGQPAAVGAKRMPALPLRSVTIGLQNIAAMPEYKASVEEILARGADTIMFVVDARMENGSAGRIYIDVRNTPTPEQIADLCRFVKSKKTLDGRTPRIILMPIVLIDKPLRDEWRGTISPHPDNGGWTGWFDSYREMMHHFSWTAEAGGVDVLVVGSELVSSQKFVDEWKFTIKKVRESFSGALTYSANWDNYTAVTFWDDLDLIGMNSYWKLGPGPQVPLAELQKNWRDIQKPLVEFLQKQKKPLIFLEMGYCSIANAAHEPWDYTKAGEPIDLDLQKRLYEAFFSTWYGHPNLGGFSIWEWTPGDGGKDDRGYTPENKPAEKVLREYLNKPAWQVTP